jgi:cytochrome d ubiquinol oxidase subunit II
MAFLSIANIPRLVNKAKYRSAFVFSALTVSLLLGLVAIELYPTLIISTLDPAYSLTVYNSASSDKSLGIMLTFAAIGIPLVIGYTYFVYRTFYGKVELDETSY